jgi:hypothetical protein
MLLKAHRMGLGNYVDFICDSDWCKLGHPKNIELQSSVFVEYRAWCKSKNLRPKGKHGLLAFLRESPAAQRFGIKPGFGPAGHPLFRGIQFQQL